MQPPCELIYWKKRSGQQQSLLSNQSFEESQFCSKHFLARCPNCSSFGQSNHPAPGNSHWRSVLHRSILHCHTHFYWMKWCEGHTHFKIAAFTLVLWRSAGIPMMFQLVPMVVSHKLAKIPTITFAGLLVGLISIWHRTPAACIKEKVCIREDWGWTIVLNCWNQKLGQVEHNTKPNPATITFVLLATPCATILLFLSSLSTHQLPKFILINLKIF